jgi:hypothetical protein
VDAVRSHDSFYLILWRLFRLYSANIFYSGCESWKTGLFALPGHTIQATGERQ